MASSVLRFAFVGATAALFLAWLTAADRAGRASTADAECIGRSATLCERHSGVAVATGLERDCVSLGRGGLLCEGALR